MTDSESFTETSTELSHADALSRIRAAGIGISSSCGCSNRYNGCCTSLDGVNTKNIDNIITLKRSSGCPITITGGTETGHASGTKSHWTGYKLDISLNDCINRYITSNFRSSGRRGDGASMYTASSGNVYAREGNHWDILYP